MSRHRGAIVAEYSTRRRLMARAAAITTTGAVPESSRLITATCALPPKINGAADHPASDGMSARAALTPMTRPNGTIPKSQGAIALAPATTSLRELGTGRGSMTTALADSSEGWELVDIPKAPGEGDPVAA